MLKISMIKNSFSSMMDPSTGNPIGQLMYVRDLLPNKIASVKLDSGFGRNITSTIVGRDLIVKHSSLSVTATTLCENSRSAWSLELKTNKGVSVIKLTDVEPMTVIDEIICLLMTKLPTKEVDNLINAGKFKSKYHPLFVDSPSYSYEYSYANRCYYLGKEIVWIERYYDYKERE